MNGVVAFDEEAAANFATMAYADFFHDFDDTTRAWIDLGILNKYPIDVTSNIKRAYPQLLEAIQTAVGDEHGKRTTAFRMFRNIFGTTIPAGAILPDQPMHEENVLASVDIPYADIVGQIAALGDRPADVRRFDVPQEFNLAGRSYHVSGVTEKVRDRHINVVSCMNALTGVTNMVIMWDAGSCEISEIGAIFNENIVPGFDQDQEYNIFFINSKENLSDPATKPTFNTTGTTNPRVNLYFLTEADPTEPTVYPVWPGNGSEQNAALYSNYNLITKRDANSPVVSGTLMTDGFPNVEVSDIKEASKVSNAVMNSVLAKLQGKPNSEQMAYFFLKRAGDWCQALTLLDKTRKYTVTPAAGNGNNIVGDNLVTLNDLERAGAKMFMITPDRVLLAYAIRIGLNVMFTNVRNGSNWMIYFENREALLQFDEETKNQIIQSSQQNLNAITDDFLNELSGGIQNWENENTDGLNSLIQNLGLRGFITIRNAIYKLARAPTRQTFEGIRNSFQGEIALVENEANDVNVRTSSLIALKSLNSKFEILFDVARGFLGDDVYPDFAEETAIIDDLIANKNNVISTTSDVYIKFQTIIDKLKLDYAKLGNQILQALPNDGQIRQHPNGQGLGATRRTRTNPEGLTSIGLLYTYYNSVFGFVPQEGGERIIQRGGAVQEAHTTGVIINKLANAKVIIPYQISEVERADIVDDSEYVAAVGSFVRLLDGSYCTVVDRFISQELNIDFAKQLFGADGFVEALNGDIDMYCPSSYMVFKTILNELDRLYFVLLELNEMDYFNPESIPRVRDIELKLESLRNTVDHIPEEGEFIGETLHTIITNYIELLQNNIFESNLSEPGYTNELFSAWDRVWNTNRDNQIQGVQLVLNDNVHNLDDQEFWYEKWKELLYCQYIRSNINILMIMRDRIIKAFDIPIPFVSNQFSTLRKYSDGFELQAILLKNQPQQPVNQIERDQELEIYNKNLLDDLIANPLAQQGGGSRLRIPFRFKPNARSSSSRVSRTSKHSRLRKWAGKGNTYRIRQRTLKARTWRQRVALGGIRPSVPVYHGGDSNVQGQSEWGSDYANNE